MRARLTVVGLLALALVLSGCLGPVSLHEAVLGYDDTVSRLGREMLLVNIGRLRHGLPVHFTLATSIAATFEYQANAAILGPFSDVGLSVGVSAAENPTVTIVPIQGKQFTERVLTPLEDTAFEFPVFQGCAYRHGHASRGRRHRSADPGGNVRAVHPELADASGGVRGVPSDRPASGLAQCHAAPLRRAAVLPGDDPGQAQHPHGG